MEIKKSYYAIIPANVRYDNNLTPNAKLLYGEITALCNEKGFCWATNSYFAELYSVTIKSISSWISKLEALGYIKTQLVYKNGTKQVDQRRIYLPYGKNVLYPMEEIFPTYGKNVLYPMEEKVKDNNTINNTINNTKEYSAYFEELWKLYPSKKGKGRISDSKKKELFKLGDELQRCISRYVEETEIKRSNGFKGLQFQNGSTFFNSGYIDYLDDNYKEMKSNGEHSGCNNEDEYSKLGWSFEDLQDM